MSDLLKSIIQDLINDRTAQASVSIHEYIVNKTQEAVGLSEGHYFDYDVWYNGMVVGNLQADTDKKAKSIMKSEYSSDQGTGTLVALRSNASKEDCDAAKAASKVTKA